MRASGSNSTPNPNPTPVGAATVEAPSRRRKRKREYAHLTRFVRTKARLYAALPYVLLAIVSLPIVVMYSWLLMNSFSKKTLFGFIPQELTLNNWRFLWEPLRIGTSVHPSIWTVTGNTLLFAGGVTVLIVLISTLAGFALSRFDFRGRQSIMQLTILLHAFPGVTLMIAIFFVLLYLMKFTGLPFLNSLWGVVLVKAALEIPWLAWIIKGFFDAIPWEVEWSAYVDGCNRFQAWYKVILPQIRPGIAAIAIFSFLAGWGEFIFLYTFIFSEAFYTLSLYLNSIIGEFQVVEYGVVAAVALFYMIPVIVFFIFTQKGLMQVTVGGLKGGR